MESNFISTKLFNLFRDEYESSTLHWVEFFNYKQHETGIIITDYTFLYKVIDERKWLLTKIKYGV